MNSALARAVIASLFACIVACVVACSGSSGDGGSGDLICGSGECKLTASDGKTIDNFGFSVSLDADVVVVGAATSDEASRTGSAYVYRFDGTDWVQEQKLRSPDPKPNDQFGIAVAVAGDVVVVGVQLDDEAGTDSGSAFVYRFDGANWVVEQMLVPADGAARDHFGISVAISGDAIVVGAYNDDDLGTDSGSAYVYRYDPMTMLWVQEQKLLASDGLAFNYFGFSVAIDGETIVAGAYLARGFAGAAYVYRYDGTDWLQEQKLVASDGVGGDFLGNSVDISGDVVVAGAYLDDEVGTDSGSAYVYRYDGAVWVEEDKLTNSDAKTQDFFGINVAVDGDRIVAGAEFHDDRGSRSGAAYIYAFDGVQWAEEQKITASDGAVGDRFGISVDLQASMAVVGASLDDGPRAKIDAGSAYVYEIDR